MPHQFSEAALGLQFRLALIRGEGHMYPMFRQAGLFGSRPLLSIAVHYPPTAGSVREPAVAQQRGYELRVTSDGFAVAQQRDYELRVTGSPLRSNGVTSSELRAPLTANHHRVGMGTDPRRTERNS